MAEEVKRIRSPINLIGERLYHSDVLTDGIIQRLMYLRNFCASKAVNVQEQNFRDPMQSTKGIQQCSHAGNFSGTQIINVKTEAVINNEDANLTDIARNAFRNENYAKCVRTVERIAALQGGKLDVSLMDLCHNSYKRIVQSALSNSDRLKLCEWWRLFIENTILDDHCDEILLCRIHWRCECMQERLKLTQSVNERINISELIIVGVIRAYEIHSQIVAPISVVKLKHRIDGLCSAVSDHLRNFPEVNKSSQVVEEGIELLRLIYNETYEELNVLRKTDAENENNKQILVAIMNEIKVVLQKCGWCIVGPHSEMSPNACSNEESRSSCQELSLNSCLYPEDIINAHF